MNPNITPEGEKAKASIAAARAKRNGIQPTVSASEIANPPASVTPPVPTVNTNTGATTSNLVGNVATNTQGFIQAQSEEAAKAKEMATLLGTQEFNAADERQGLTDKFGVTGNLSRLTDIQTQLTNANTESAATKTRIQGADGQTLGQAQRAVTQEDRENAVRTVGLAAEAAVLQGSIETASTLINNAMTDFYSDRTLKNQNMIQQLEYFSGIADEQTKQLLGKEQRKYEADQKQVERVLSAVDSAVASGEASADEIKRITDPKTPDFEKERIANTVIARNARTNLQLERTLASERIASERRSNLPKDILLPTEVIEQGGKKLLINSQTGEVIADFSGSDKSVSELTLQKQQDEILMTDKLASDAGLNSAVGPTGIARIGLIDEVTGAKDDFIAAIDSLTKGLTIDELLDAKAKGATFGALNEQEFGTLEQAATKINGMRVKDKDTGETQYFDASEKTFKDELDLINGYRKLDAVLKGADPVNVGVIVTEDGGYWTVGHDGQMIKLR